MVKKIALSLSLLFSLQSFAMDTGNVVSEGMNVVRVIDAMDELVVPVTVLTIVSSYFALMGK